MALVTDPYSVAQFKRSGICHFHFPPDPNNHSIIVMPLYFFSIDSLFSDALSHLLHDCCHGLMQSSWLNHVLLAKGIILIHRYNHINLEENDSVAGFSMWFQRFPCRGHCSGRQEADSLLLTVYQYSDLGRHPALLSSDCQEECLKVSSSHIKARSWQILPAFAWLLSKYPFRSTCLLT